MPIYEYQCLECGNRLELRRSMSEGDGEVACPRCGKKNVRRTMSMFAGGSFGCDTGGSGGGGT